MVLEDREIQISVVIPVWNEEEENIREIYLRLNKTLAISAPAYEILFIDDGSGDKTFKFLRTLLSDKHVRIVKLTRNFGQIPAILAGLQYAKGKTMVTMDIDLQCVPEDIPKLLDKIDRGHDIVSGWRKNRQGYFFTRNISSYMINKFIQKKTGVKFHDWGCPFNAAKSSLVAKLKDFGRTARFTKPLLAHLATSPVEVEVQHYPRKIGKSKYSLFRLAKTALDIFVNFSLIPTVAHKPLFVAKEVLE